MASRQHIGSAQQARRAGHATCQICGRSIQASMGVIAHHGYTRPYQGWQTASCAGARYLPYEQSCDRLREMIEVVARFLAEQEQELQTFLKTPPDEIVTYEKRSAWGQTERKVYPRPDHLDLTGFRRCRPGTYEQAIAHYQRRNVPSWFIAWLNGLYIQLGENPRRLILDELLTLQSLSIEDRAWMPPDLAVNTVFKYHTRIGLPTTGMADH